jgi:hypothetical protein
MMSPLVQRMNQTLQPHPTSGLEAPLAAQDAILRCQAALLAREGLGDAATALAVEIAELFACHRVSVWYRRLGASPRRAANAWAGRSGRWP